MRVPEVPYPGTAVVGDEDENGVIVAITKDADGNYLRWYNKDGTIYRWDGDRMVTGFLTESSPTTERTLAGLGSPFLDRIPDYTVEREFNRVESDLARYRYYKKSLSKAWGRVKSRKYNDPWRDWGLTVDEWRADQADGQDQKNKNR